MFGKGQDTCPLAHGLLGVFYRWVRFEIPRKEWSLLSHCLWQSEWRISFFRPTHTVYNLVFMSTPVFQILFLLATWMNILSLCSYFLNYMLLLSRAVISILVPGVGKDSLRALPSFGARLLLNLARGVSQHQMPFYRRIFLPLGGTGAQFTLPSHFWALRRQGVHPLYRTCMPQLWHCPGGCPLIFYQDSHEVRTLAGYFNESRNMYHR